MRKLLLGTTALAAAATLTANAALADVSISGGYEWKYSSRSSNVTANDGTIMSKGDGSMTVTFTNKTDSGLDITYTVDMETSTDSAALVNDETHLSIAGGFGKIILGYDDDASDAYNIDESDLIAEDNAPSVTSATIGTSSSVPSDDDMKVVYHLPAMGGLTAGISHTDRTRAGGTDTTAYGAKYSMEAAGASITLGYAAVQDENSTQDKDYENMGMKVVSGDISLIISQGGAESDDEDIENQGASISYTMPNGMTVGAYTFKSEDDLDAGEEYSRSGVEVQYTIASGLTAVINVDDYDYKEGGSDTSTTHVNDSGTQTTLTIKASF